MRLEIEMIFRKDKEGNIIAFIPYDYKVNYGNIMCYQHIGQHSVASIEFYRETRKAKKDEYKELLEELESIYSDYKIVIKQKINYERLKNSWV